MRADDRDVPDVVGFADVAAAPDVVHQLIRTRVERGELFDDRAAVPLSKGPGKPCRRVTVLNPLDELTMRTYVGRCAPAIARTTHDSVLNGRIEQPGPGWVPADFRPLAKRRRRLRMEHYDDPRTAGVALFDVKDFFASCDHEVLQQRLIAAGAPAGAAAALHALFEGLHAGRGLPVGFEGSGQLANLFLAHLDADLDRHRLRFVRWTDDLDVFFGAGDDPDRIVEMVAAAVAEVGLELNAGKCEVLAKGPAALDRLGDASRDSITVGETIADAAADLHIAAVLAEWMGPEQLPPADVRAFLRRCGGSHDLSGVGFLQEHPEWIGWEPRVVGDYLCALASSPSARARLDLDWMLEVATNPAPKPEQVAGQVHMCRALAASHVDETRGRQLLETAVGFETVTQRPIVGGWALRAWSDSRAWRAHDARSVIAEYRSSYRRAAAFGYVARDHGAALRTAAKRHGDLEPMAALAA